MVLVLFNSHNLFSLVSLTILGKVVLIELKSCVDQLNDKITFIDS